MLMTVLILLFDFHKVVLDMLLCSFFYLLPVGLTAHYLGHAGGCVVSHTLNIIWKVVEPESAEFFEDGLRFFWESNDEMS